MPRLGRRVFAETEGAAGQEMYVCCGVMTTRWAQLDCALAVAKEKHREEWVRYDLETLLRRCAESAADREAVKELKGMDQGQLGITAWAWAVVLLTGCSCRVR